MIKLLTAQQLRELDAQTIKHEKIESWDLMERAANSCLNWIVNKFNRDNSFLVVCGTGNNGGDGLVIARLLHHINWDVECVLVNSSNQLSHDNSLNLQRLKKTGCKITSISSEEHNSIDFDGKIVIDTLFGTGLSRPAEGIEAMLISKINQSNPKSVVSIDLPSGLYCDSLNSEKDTIVNADFTLTFHAPKLSFFFPEGGNTVGKVIVLDIGLNKNFALKMVGKNHYITPESVSKYLKKRKTFTHKGTYGHSNIIAGSRGKMGAAILAVKAASFSGVGLVTATVPSVGLNVLQVSNPTAMCDDKYGNDVLEGKIQIDENHTYGVGPGIGTHQSTIDFFSCFLEKINRPILIDADGLNIIANHPALLKKIPENSILTPHVKEFHRLVGETENSLERLEKLISFSIENKVFVVLKDARTIIATPNGNCYFSLNGSPGMATGGSGDVLSGLLTGLLSQGFTPNETVQLGVVLHGVSGELAAHKFGENAMTASSIVECLGEGFKTLLGLKGL